MGFSDDIINSSHEGKWNFQDHKCPKLFIWEEVSQIVTHESCIW